MPFSSANSLVSGSGRAVKAVVVAIPLMRHMIPAMFSVLVAFKGRDSRSDIYNILWAVVFGFATLNILSLAARRTEATRRGMSFGELLAVMVVLISIFLLGWEMLNLFHIFPIRLRR
jgi:uncharacterized membrane protein